MRHNDVFDFESNLIVTSLQGVEEPHLQPLSGETIVGVNGDDAHTDIRAQFLAQESKFVFRCTCYISMWTHVCTIYRKHEQERMRAYNERILNIEQGSFTPLVYSVTSGVGPECSMFHKHITERMVEKSGERYEDITTHVWYVWKEAAHIRKTVRLSTNLGCLVKNSVLVMSW